MKFLSLLAFGALIGTASFVDARPKPSPSSGSTTTTTTTTSAVARNKSGVEKKKWTIILSDVKEGQDGKFDISHADFMAFKDAFTTIEEMLGDLLPELAQNKRLPKEKRTYPGGELPLHQIKSKKQFDMMLEYAKKLREVRKTLKKPAVTTPTTASTSTTATTTTTTTTQPEAQPPQAAAIPPEVEKMTDEFLKAKCGEKIDSCFKIIELANFFHCQPLLDGAARHIAAWIEKGRQDEEKKHNVKMGDANYAEKMKTFYQSINLKFGYPAEGTKQEEVAPNSNASTTTTTTTTTTSPDSSVTQKESSKDKGKEKEKKSNKSKGKGKEKKL